MNFHIFFTKTSSSDLFSITIYNKQKNQKLINKPFLAFGENMKFKYFFALVLIVTIIFSFGTVMANEDVNASSTQDAYLSVDDQSLGSASEDIQLSDDTNQGSDLIGDDSPSDEEEVDLSVNMEIGDTKKETFGIGDVTFEVPMIITAKAVNGTAKNVKVNVTMPEFFTYLSHTKTVGEYDPESGIWNIGDLSSGVNATLTILTKISQKGKYIIYVNATTDSMEKVLSNNNLECNIEVSSKITSNTTRTSADQGTQHTPHENSDPGSGGRINNGDNHPENGGNPGSGSGSEGGSSENGGGSGSGTGSGGGSSQPGSSTSPSNGGSSGNGGSNSPSENGGGNSPSGNGGSSSGSQESSGSSRNVAKEISPNVFGNAIKSIGGTVEDLLNPNSSEDDEEDSNGSVSVVKEIGVYDYTQIPLMIFALFLVALVGIFAYDKIKS